jgi:sugar phosphate isomerase/epimerase
VRTAGPSASSDEPDNTEKYLDALDNQWHEVAIPFWKDIEARARDADVRVCIEMHPHNVVFNPGTMERLATEINATHVGAEMDPSRLFWQGIDPVAAIERLGGGRGEPEGRRGGGRALSGLAAHQPVRVRSKLYREAR